MQEVCENPHRLQSLLLLRLRLFSLATKYRLYTWNCSGKGESQGEWEIVSSGTFHLQEPVLASPSAVPRPIFADLV
jgi:hypothetical protein